MPSLTRTHLFPEKYVLDVQFSLICNVVECASLASCAAQIDSGKSRIFRNDFLMNSCERFKKQTSRLYVVAVLIGLLNYGKVFEAAGDEGQGS